MRLGLTLSAFESPTAQKRVAQAIPKEVWRIETVSLPPAPGPRTALNSEGPVVDLRGATMKAPVISLSSPGLR